MTSLQSSHGLLSWHCHDCNMTFTNPALLQKHKARFCIGKPGIVLLQTPEFDDKPLPEPPEEPTPRSKFDPDARIRELSESHRRLMEYLQNKNLDLEKQREEIRRQLEALGRRPVAKDNSSEDLIRELREREEANQRLLVELRRQLMEARRPVNIIQSSSEPAPQPQLEKKSFIYPMYYGPSLVAEIIAVRQAYMQNGGTDPDILSQLADMLAEAQAIEEALKNAQKRQPKDKKDGSSSQLMILEVENERLQRQLVLLQDQKASIAARRKGNRDRDRESDLERELHRMHREHLRKMYELQREIERLRQESMLDRMRLELQVQQPPSIILQQPSGTTHLLPVSEAVPAGPPQAAAAAPPPPPPPTTQRHPPAPTASALPPATQRDGSTTILLPYDEYDGFVIFFDFVLNLESTIHAVRLLVGLHDLTNKLGEPSVLPMVYTEPATNGEFMEEVCNAVIGARQPVHRCPAQSDLGIVTELQVAGAIGSNHDPTRLITRAWTKIPLFDGQGQLYTGRYKLQLRHSPIKPYIPFAELDSIAQYRDSELYYRIVHHRDATLQSMVTVTATSRDLYQPAPVARLLPHLVAPIIVPPPPSTSPPHSLPQSVFLPNSRLSSRRWNGMTTMTEHSIGFQVDRVKHSELGEGKVRLTAYYVSSGEIVQSSDSVPVTCTTTSSMANFKQDYHMFGQQEVLFNDIQCRDDILLIAFFYLKKWPQPSGNDMFSNPTSPQQDWSTEDGDFLVAWTALPLVVGASKAPSTSDPAAEELDSNSEVQVNTGTKTLPLFMPPVPEPVHIPFQHFSYRHQWQPYGKATLRLHIFQGQPRLGSITPSQVSTIDDVILPESVWLPKERVQPPTEPFLTGDGFDIYIDGCRFLPDSVTITKVAGRILDRRCQTYGKDISTSVKADSDIYNPVYEHREEFREVFIPPSATLLLKVYTIDRFSNRLTVVGYASLNVFVETGTEKQPSVDKPGLQVSVNEGGHQLRLYHWSPDPSRPFHEASLRDNRTAIIPCASLLVRLHKVPSGPRGRPLESRHIPQSDWMRLGLWHPRPKYSQRAYLSSKCSPTPGETKLFPSMVDRPAVSIRSAVGKLSGARDGFLQNDKNVHHFIRNKLMKNSASPPLNQDLAFITPYSPRHGIRCALEGAVNIPWANFTFGHFCLNPPGAFYKGSEYANYDKLTFTENLKADSTNSSPVWKDGYKYFPRRSYHRYLCVIIHLQEIFVKSSKSTLKYGLLQQAWTAVQVFQDRYACVSTFQLPLLSGSPSQDTVHRLTQVAVKDWMAEAFHTGSVKLLDDASVYFRISDARRDEESEAAVDADNPEEVNREYLPKDKKKAYRMETVGKPLTSLVPKDQDPAELMTVLAAKFKSLVYKLNEERDGSKKK